MASEMQGDSWDFYADRLNLIALSYDAKSARLDSSFLLRVNEVEVSVNRDREMHWYSEYPAYRSFTDRFRSVVDANDRSTHNSLWCVPHDWPYLGRVLDFGLGMAVWHEALLPTNG